MKFGRLFNKTIGTTSGKPMKCDEIDFEGNGSSGTEGNKTEGSGDSTSDGNKNNTNTEPNDLDGNSNGTTSLDGNQNIEGETEGNATTPNNQNQNATVSVNPGDEIELDGVKYTVDDNGNIVDADGNIFQEAANVEQWLKEQNVIDNHNDEINIENIIQSVGIDITDDEGNPVEFTNDADGIKSYIDNVMELRANEIANATMDRFFNEAPIVKDFLDYLTVNGSPIGFGEIRDLSNVTLDRDNENQLENVIRAAAKEFGNSTLSESYIKYLKDSGGLYDEANRQLQAMVTRDKELAEERKQQADAARKEQEAKVTEYWNNVKSTIDKREIAGYKIPESFTLENDGKKVILTPNDFWSYLTYRDKQTGLSEYQKDLNAMTDEDIMNNELLDAWLHFTGRSYKDLINMELKKEQVRQLKLSSKNNATRGSIKINRHKSNSVNIDSIILG
uniref:Uncharacterized protein n=1 Tax=Geladintestivirus 1 TaxID=3233133 RepID=A0AAU8MI96_9CAUD